MELGTGDQHTEYIAGMASTASAYARLGNVAAAGPMEDLTMAAWSTSRTMNSAMGGGMRIVHSLNTLGVLNQEAVKAIAMAAAGAQAGRAVFTITRALINLRKAMRTRELAMATAETTANAIAQNWVGIALAVGAAATVTASFSIGKYYGEMSRPKELQYVMADARRDAVGG